MLGYMVKDELQAGTLLERGRFRVQGLLGRGGFGAVYVAEQLATGQRVALKVLNLDRTDGSRAEREIARFTREMRLVGHISHPNVVRLIDFGEMENGRLFTAFEYIAGEDLAALVDREGPLPVGEAVRIMRQVLEALSAAHRHGVVHRDLKPQNIMVTDHGLRANAMVVDFGVSFVSEDRRDPDYRTLTIGDEVAGTPHYMAPEQLLYGQAGVKSDVFAWGLVFLEALTGWPAHAETSLVQLLLRHTRAVPLVIPPLLAESPLGPLLARATAYSPEARYDSAEQALQDLEALDLRAVDRPALERGLRESWEVIRRSGGAEAQASSPAQAPVAELTIDAVPGLTPPRVLDRTELSTNPRALRREVPPPVAPAAQTASPAPVERIPTTAEASAVKRPSGSGARPDKPSIIVLPFANLSGDAEQEFFADGLTEDVLTDLSRFHELFVISRNTAFRYKGKPVDVQQVAREASVQYVIQGSVRKAGNRVRISVQLTDAELDRQVWAERYDRELADIFDIQDEVTAALVATLAGRVEASTRKRSARKTPEEMAAYECVLAGKLLHHRVTRADNTEALRYMERAIELDPDYAHAHAWKACIAGQAWTYGWAEDALAVERTCEREAQLALSLDENDSDVHRVLAALCITRSQLERAWHHQQRALSLNPNDDLIVVQHGELLTWMGQGQEGIEWIRKAMRLNPFHPPRFWYHLARACFVARRYREAIDALESVPAPEVPHLAFLAASHAMLGDRESASRYAAEVLAREPGFCIETHLLTMHYKRVDDAEHHRVALRTVGFPG